MPVNKQFNPRKATPMAIFQTSETSTRTQQLGFPPNARHSTFHTWEAVKPVLPGSTGIRNIRKTPPGGPLLWCLWALSGGHAQEGGRAVASARSHVTTMGVTVPVPAIDQRRDPHGEPGQRKNTVSDQRWPSRSIRQAPGRPGVVPYRPAKSVQSRTYSMSLAERAGV